MTEVNEAPVQRAGALTRFFGPLVSVLKLDKLSGGGKSKPIGAAVAVLLLVMLGISIYWGQEPDLFDVRAEALARAEKNKQLEEGKLVNGYVSVSTLAYIAEKLMDKPGGYLSNDKMPPSVFMDNIPRWEYGVLVQVRDFSKALRDDMGRSQTQSIEDKDLKEAQPRFNVDNNSWMFPASETQYKNGIKYLEAYMARLTNDRKHDGVFFSRSDNLREWFKTVEKRLGSLSHRLSESVGQARLNVDLAGDAEADEAKRGPREMTNKTPWLEIDDIFYEARGTAWALIHLLHAVEIDFKGVLEDKNALVSLQQIVRELEATQKTLWSPMVLNGSKFGLFANHSLVMSSYISRANAGIIDLRRLLYQG
ncbi:MAG: DUF2333 family protein [Gammaproteobacteria bacterium]|nr:DUF2333 family protein [Gammaproteobacteria bacterium]